MNIKHCFGIKRLLLAAACAAGLLLAGCGEGPTPLPGKTTPTPSTEQIGYEERLGLSEDELWVSVNGMDGSASGVLQQGKAYLPLSLLMELESRLYWNEAEEELLYTDAKVRYSYWPGVSHHGENEQMVEDAVPELIVLQGQVYVGEGIYSRCRLKTVRYHAPERLLLQTDGASYEMTRSTAQGDAALRSEPDMTSPLYGVLPEGTPLYVLSADDERYLRVMTGDGMVGYLAREAAGEVTKGQFAVEDLSPAYEHNTMTGELHMVWHQVFAKQGGSDLKKAVDGTKGLQVICPTWYKVTGEDGSITSLADKSYVKRAHELGLSVWCLVDDFTPGVSGLAVLSNSASRAHLIESLIAETTAVGADGINVDFEYITSESAPHFLQFLRELYLASRKAGLVISVDNYVPYGGNAFYDLETQKDVADYVVLMTYDEHHGNSTEAGSVASLGFVTAGIEAALLKVPANRLVMGIPFYARLWKTVTAEDGSTVVTSEAYGMNSLRKRADNAGAAWTWLDDCAQYYTEFEEDGALYQIWLEDADSIERKLAVMREKQLAGFGCWKLGLEDESVWDLLGR